AVELRAFGRQHEQHEPFVFAGLLERGHELGAAVDLDAFDGEREGRDELIEEVLGAACSRSREGFGCGEACDWIVSGDLLDRLIGPHIDGEGIDLHEFAWGRGLLAFWQPERVFAAPLAGSCALAPAQRGYPFDDATRHQVSNDATDGAVRNNE